MNASPLPSRPLKAYAAAARGVLWLLLAAWLLLALAWGTLHGWIVPRISELRPVLEKQATRVVGVPVRIGSISARSEGLIPSFELRDVVLLDPQGREALRLGRVLAALSPRSAWNLGFEQLYIDRPELDIRRAADGRIFVAGLDFSKGGDDDGRAAEWLFSQREFVVRGGTLRWTDEMRGAPPLALSQVDLVLRNRTRRHHLRLDATPPAEWGARFMLAGQFRQPLLSGRNGQWRDWVGQAYAEFTQVDLSQLRRHADIGVRIEQGRGAVRAWADVDRGRVTGGAADVALAEVEATLAAGLQPLALQSLTGRLGGRRDAEGFDFQTQALAFTTREGLRWPGGNLALTWRAPQGSKPAQGELKADKLDLAALGQIASRLPLGTATHAALAAYAPQGLVEAVQARWQGEAAAPVQYSAKGRASGLEVRARPAADGHGATPGVRGASMDFDFTQAGGKARLAIANGALDLPGVFDEPVLDLQSLAADVQWQREGDRIGVNVSNLKFSNADAQGEGRASWKTADAAGKPRFPGVLDLEATLTRAEGTRVWRYLPLGVPKAARDYVRESVQRGKASNAKFRVRGDLHEFPWADGKRGEFLVTADVADAQFAYVPARALKPGQPPWPALTQVAAELVFQGNGMQVRHVRGRFTGGGGLTFKADATIPDFHTTTVQVTSQIQGPLGDALAVVNTSPVGGLLNGALAKATGTGPAEVRLLLDLPVAHIEQSRVSGSVTLANSDVQVSPDSPLLTRARGSVAFSEKGFAIQGVQARALGGDVRLEGGTRPVTPMGEVPILLRAQGTATAEGLRQARELGFVSRIARDASGAAAYTLNLGFRRGTTEIALNTNLQGMALALPAPLNKAADTALPLRYETALTADTLSRPAGPGQPLHDQLLVEIGRVGSVVYVRDLAGAEPRVLRGAIALGLAPGESVALPELGVLANINLATVQGDAWEEALDRIAAGAPAAGTPAPRGTGSSAASSYLPTALAIRARELSFEGRTLHNVVVGGSREGLTWRANVDANELNGYLEYRQPAGNGSGRLHARLARLRIAASEARQVETLLDEQPSSIPALDIVVDEFELRGKKLGRLEIDAVNRGALAVARDGGVREWRLNKLALTSPEASFSATGNWAALNAQGGAPAGAERRRTVMNFRWDIGDAGGLLARFGMPDVVRRGRGRMEGQVAWAGSPLSLDYPSMNGSFAVSIENGQFLKADPGLAKLLGVLSLQTLPRRLALDFRDVFSEGFSFDFIRGDVSIQQGIASTNNLQMKGVNAAVLMEGRADIARETQDLKVVVVPEINAGTASLVAGVINPAIGIGTFLAQMFLRQPLIRAATQEFHIDGTWADPRVTRVPKAPAASGAAPATAEPAR